jgi:hypothetical protein
MFDHRRRGPGLASIFVTAHDDFTLAIWSATTKHTMRRLAKTARTAVRTTDPGIAAFKDPTEGPINLTALVAPRRLAHVSGTSTLCPALVICISNDFSEPETEFWN